jgi:predicted nucleotidyltransferase
MAIVTKGESAQREIEMTKRKPGLTLDEHLEQAIAFRLIKEKLDDLKNECGLKFPANHRIVRSLKKAKENRATQRH